MHSYQFICLNSSLILNHSIETDYEVHNQSRLNYSNNLWLRDVKLIQKCNLETAEAVAISMLRPPLSAHKRFVRVYLCKWTSDRRVHAHDDSAVAHDEQTSIY